MILPRPCTGWHLHGAPSPGHAGLSSSRDCMREVYINETSVLSVSLQQGCDTSSACLLQEALGRGALSLAEVQQWLRLAATPLLGQLCQCGQPSGAQELCASMQLQNATQS